MRRDGVLYRLDAKNTGLPHYSVFISVTPSLTLASICCLRITLTIGITIGKLGKLLALLSLTNTLSTHLLSTFGMVSLKMPLPQMNFLFLRTIYCDLEK